MGIRDDVFFGCHNAGNSGCFKHVSLLNFLGDDTIEGIRLHVDNGLSQGGAKRGFFFGDIHHSDPAFIVDVGKRHAQSP